MYNNMILIKKIIVYKPDNANVVVIVVRAAFGDTIPNPSKLASPMGKIFIYNYNIFIKKFVYCIKIVKSYQMYT